MKTVVVFRKFKDDGQLIALFPELPDNRDGYLCESYMHNGEHAAADPLLAKDGTTVAATPEEYAEMAQVLKARGYDLKIAKRISAKMNQTRMDVGRK